MFQPQLVSKKNARETVQEMVFVIKALASAIQVRICRIFFQNFFSQCSDFFAKKQKTYFDFVTQDLTELTVLGHSVAQDIAIVTELVKMDVVTVIQDILEVIVGVLNFARETAHSEEFATMEDVNVMLAFRVLIAQRLSLAQKIVPRGVSKIENNLQIVMLMNLLVRDFFFWCFLFSKKKVFA